MQQEPSLLVDERAAAQVLHAPRVAPQRKHDIAPGEGAVRVLLIVGVHLLDVQLAGAAHPEQLGRAANRDKGRKRKRKNTKRDTPAVLEDNAKISCWRQESGHAACGGSNGNGIGKSTPTERKRKKVLVHIKRGGAELNPGGERIKIKLCNMVPTVRSA